MTILDDIPMERNWTFSYVFKARSTRNPDIFETVYIFFTRIRVDVVRLQSCFSCRHATLLVGRSVA